MKFMGLLLIWFASGGVANWLTFLMVSDVNRHQPEGEQFDYLWWYWAKSERLWRAHRRLFPKSKKRLAIIGCFAIMAAGVFILPQYSSK